MLGAAGTLRVPDLEGLEGAPSGRVPQGGKRKKRQSILHMHYLI